MKILIQEKKRDNNNYIRVDFDLRFASTNTRPEGFKNPVVVDNKKDIDKIINKLSDVILIEYFMNKSLASKWKFYRFLDDDKQLKLLSHYEHTVKNATSLKTRFESLIIILSMSFLLSTTTGFLKPSGRVLVDANP